VKNLAGEIGHEWAARKKASKDTADLKALVDEIVPFNVKHGSEPEACDLLMEVDLLPQVRPLNARCSRPVQQHSDAVQTKLLLRVFYLDSAQVESRCCSETSH
jgi:hypothetical protein